MSSSYPLDGDTTPKHIWRGNKGSYEYVLMTNRDEHQTFEEATLRDDRDHWTVAMKDEMDYLQHNKIFNRVQLPKEKKALRDK